MTIEKIETLIQNSTYLKIHLQHIFKIIFNNISTDGDKNTPEEYIDMRKISWTHKKMLHLADMFKNNKLKIYK